MSDHHLIYEFLLIFFLLYKVIFQHEFQCKEWKLDEWNNLWYYYVFIFLN